MLLTSYDEAPSPPVRLLPRDTHSLSLPPKTLAIIVYLAVLYSEVERSMRRL